MDIVTSGKNIYLKNKVVSKLDLFVIDFINILKKYADYTVVSGYVSILFGRSRGTEDIDILIKIIDLDTFIKFYKELTGKKYWFLNAENPMELYGMLEDKLAIRIAAKEAVIPNIEIKFIKSDLDKASLDEHKVVNIGKDTINISPIELQIAFKLYLGSDKDIEDAVYLYEIFIKYIDKKKLNQYMNILKVKGAKYGIEI
ncbi:MAG: hypothetical protein FIB08_09270 [Candidatus Methanoperedens sp.]|nr:hypothetical protein [Candidatus Methanoperedens sp.]